MIKTQFVDCEDVALDFYGESFVRMPRKVFGMMKSEKIETRRRGTLLAFLFGNCYFESGSVELNGHTVRCGRGEYVGSQREIADLLDMKSSTANRILHSLAEDRLIAIEAVEGGSRIRVLGYDKFTSSSPGSVKKKTTPKGAKTTKTPDNQWLEYMERIKRMGGKTPKY